MGDERLKKSKKFAETRAFQWVMIVIGWALVIIAPIVSWLPGPGGIALLVLGGMLILKNSLWAKRQYAKHSKRNPEYGGCFNWALRRKRFRRRPPFPPVWRDVRLWLGQLRRRLISD